MRTNNLNPLLPIFPAVLLTTAKIILPLLVLLYGVINFSVHYWIILALFVVGMLAISDRLSRINAVYKNDITKNSNPGNADGGTFNHVDKNTSRRVGLPVVQDGGIHKFKSQK